MTRRTIYAAVLVIAALTVLLVAWFVSGWADVRAQQRDVRAQPAREADARGRELAHDLHAELGRLLTREVERPYFHYQNLFHDPRAGSSVAVTPSPLATGPEDPLILGYFQLDAAGRASTPTINDDVPSLSEPRRLAENRRFRDEVIRGFAAALRPTDTRDTVVAEATPKPKVKGTVGTKVPPQIKSQTVEVDQSSYAQNMNPNETFWQQNAVPPRSGENRQQKGPPPQQAQPPQQQRVVVRDIVQPATRFHAAAEDAPVMITISPFEWRTLPYAGAPALVAVRRVETPDGALAQGFVIDRTSLTSWLASHAGDAVAELRTGDDASAAEIAPGWHLDVSANPRAMAASIADSARIASAFILRFVLVGIVALLTAAGAVLLVSRAERLARQRSQFAAAAAHELRTPLAGLQLYGDMLADGLGDPGKLRDYARRMSEEASRLGRVVANVLGFSQLERGNLSVDARRGALGAALCELAERAQPALDRAGAALALDVPPDLEARFDRDALVRIVGNLLDNAEKYSRDAEDRTIDLGARDLGDRVEITVTDRGPGVTPAARSKLFRAFSRGVSSDGPAGLGLGLALSQSLARAMGGELEYRPGATGATFVLRLLK